MLHKIQCNPERYHELNTFDALKGKPGSRHPRYSQSISKDLNNPMLVLNTWFGIFKSSESFI